ncbi:hypothetical protein BaRGS_00027554 [Batillaria attramentaria]|uniref:C2H2-type domain-containing protein n=1 Tax=Batillaria attramentaria TaxID=370345 RepID=A0ABD0K237_9CAEN
MPAAWMKMHYWYIYTANILQFYAVRRSEGHGQARPAGRVQGQRMRVNTFRSTSLSKEPSLGDAGHDADLEAISKSLGGQMPGFSLQTPSEQACSQGHGKSGVASVTSQFQCNICLISFQSSELLNLHIQFMHSKSSTSGNALGASALTATHASTSTSLPSLISSQNFLTNAALHGWNAHTADYENSYAASAESHGPVTLLPSTASMSPQQTPQQQQTMSQGRMWCKYCRRRFLGADGASFAQHVVACKQKATCKCGQCGRVFGSKVAYNDHVDSMHSKKGFRCNACGMVFKWRTYVYQHRLKCAVLRTKQEPF